MQTVQTAPIVRQLKYALRANEDRNVYIGSGEKARGLSRSPLAMPYELRIMWTGDQEKDAAARDEKIGQYKIWLWRIMRNPQDPRHAAVWTELRKLRADSILLCYCYPRNCHGHVIVAAWEWARDNGKIDIPRAEPPMQQTMNKAADEERMQTTARRNAKELSAEDKAELDRRFPDKPAALMAPGPLDMCAIMDKLAASLGTEIPDPNALHEEGKIIQHVCTPDTAHLIDARLDETILEKCTCDKHDYCQEPETAEGAYAELERLSKVHVPYVPRKKPRKGIVYSVADPYYNEVDDVTADLTDLYTFDASFDRESIALAS